MFLFRGRGGGGKDAAAAGQQPGPRNSDGGLLSSASFASDEADTIDVQLAGALDVGAVLSARCRMPVGCKKARFRWQRLGRLGAGHAEVIPVRGLSPLPCGAHAVDACAARPLTGREGPDVHDSTAGPRLLATRRVRAPAARRLHGRGE